ncbi:MAG TPA: hypothetical protein VGM86_20405 [Thermoanaerobaculia bacterium]|jgi:hypothetical protein
MDTTQIVTALGIVTAIGTAVNAIAVVVLVFVTRRYANASEALLERVDRQLESASHQSEFLYLTAEILAHSALVQGETKGNSMRILELLAKDLVQNRKERSKSPRAEVEPTEAGS